MGILSNKKKGNIKKNSDDFIDFGVLNSKKDMAERKALLRKRYNELLSTAASNPVHMMELQKVSTAIWLLGQNKVGSTAFRYKSEGASQRRQIRNFKNESTTKPVLVRNSGKGTITVSRFQQTIIIRRVENRLEKQGLKPGTKEYNQVFIRHIASEGYGIRKFKKVA
jgi:hypothetical protein